MVGHSVWAMKLAEQASFVDRRHAKRFAAMLEDKINRPEDSILQASDTVVSARAAYEFLGNPRVESCMIASAFRSHTARRCCEHSTVLVIHDTTTINLTGSTTIPELGPIDSGYLAKGAHLHTSLCLDTTGVVLGVGAQQVWTRPFPVDKGASKSVPKEDIDKESHKWIEGIEVVHQAVGEASVSLGTSLPQLIHVADREADVYEVLQTLDDLDQSGIIRSVQNRTLEDSVNLAHDAVRQQAVLGMAALPIPRSGGRPERTAHVELRVLSATLQPNRDKTPHAWPMTWTLVEVFEPNPPEGSSGLHWLLWTRLPTSTVDEVLRIVTYYTYRWKVEDFHFTFKSGCEVEELRLRTFPALEKAVRMWSGVAARLVEVRDAARETPEAPATLLLSEDECAVLQLKFGPKNDPFRIPLTMRQAILWIGRLGGHPNRKGDGMPGVKTLWQGLRDLAVLVDGYRIAKRFENTSPKRKR